MNAADSTSTTTLPAVAGRLETPVRPHRTEWAEIAEALRREYGHLLHFRGLPRWDFSKHVYAGRAGALLLKAEKQEALLLEVAGKLAAVAHAGGHDDEAERLCDRVREFVRPNAF